MAKQPYMPGKEDEQVRWFETFSSRLNTYAAAVGVTAAEVVDVTNSFNFLHWMEQSGNLYDAFSKELTAYKNRGRKGGTATQTALGAAPAVPAMPAAPATLPAPGFMPRIALMIQRVKKHPAYTDAIGEALGIIGTEADTDMSDSKPDITAKSQAGHVLLKWTKGASSGLDIYVDRGDGAGVHFIATANGASYIDAQEMPAAGAVWKYTAIYRQGTEQVGLKSDELKVSVPM